MLIILIKINLLFVLGYNYYQCLAFILVLNIIYLLFSYTYKNANTFENHSKRKYWRVIVGLLWLYGYIIFPLLFKYSAFHQLLAISWHLNVGTDLTDPPLKTRSSSARRTREAFICFETFSPGHHKSWTRWVLYKVRMAERMSARVGPALTFSVWCAHI